MRKLILPLFVLILISLSVGCKREQYANLKGSGSSEDQERPIAIVETDTITLKEFNRGMNDHGWHRQKNPDSMNFKNMVLRDMIVDASARIKAHDYPLVMDTELERRLVEHLNGVLRNQIYLDKIKSQVSIGDEEVQKTYDDNLDQFATPAKAKVAQILFSTYRPYLEHKYGFDESATVEEFDEHARGRLNLVLEELKQGRTFEELAREYSDDTISGLKGGVFGDIVKGDAEPVFDSAAFSLPIGEISEPLHTRFGYHLIKILERSEAGYRPLDSNLADAIRQELENQKTRELAARYFDSLVAVSEITYNEELINSLDSVFDDYDWASIINGSDTVHAWVYYRLENGEKAKDPRIKIDSRIRRELLQQVTQAWILVVEARKNGYDKTPRYEEARRDFIYAEKLNRLMSERFDKDYEPTDVEIEEYYLTHKDEFSEDSAISIQQLIVEDRETALKAKAEIDSGANFYQIALEYFPGEDEEIKKMSINLGWITPEEISEDFFRQLFMLDMNQVSEPIKTAWGYHLVKILGKKGLKPLDNVSVDIRKKLINIHKQDMQEKWEAGIVDGISVKVDKQLLAEFDFHVEWLPKPDLSKMFRQ
jgi:parvulin-like peptidyl-prolyl isomerase